MAAMAVPDFDSDAALAALRLKDWEERLLERRTRVKEEIETNWPGVFSDEQRG